MVCENKSYEVVNEISSIFAWLANLSSNWCTDLHAMPLLRFLCMYSAVCNVGTKPNDYDIYIII